LYSKGIEHNRHRVKSRVVESVGIGRVFITLLEGIVYTLGAIIAALASWFGWRWLKGERVPFFEAFTPTAHDEPAAKRAYVTPDVIRT
jgi:hypothetical protein